MKKGIGQANGQEEKETDQMKNEEIKDQMAKEAKEHLEQVILPFWMKLKDVQFGGYFSLVDYELMIQKQSSKGCILNSRILWFFSNGAMVLQKKDLLDYARHAYLFLKNTCIDIENGGVFWSISYDGKVEDDTKHTYNQAFAIYALSSYYDASGEEEALSLALELFCCIEEKCKDETGYLECFDSRFQPVPNEKLSGNGIIADRTMNTLLHIFEAYTELYRVLKKETEKEKVKGRMIWILELFRKKVYNPEKRRLEVFFDKEMNSLLDLHSYGHDIEAAWLLDRGVELLENEEYSKLVKPITKELTEEIYQNAFNGYALPSEQDEDFVWWVQAETVVGLVNGFEKSPDQIYYLTSAQKTWKFIQNYFLDKRPGGEWFAAVSSLNMPVSSPIADPWKCPYHNGRMCFELIKRSRLPYLF